MRSDMKHVVTGQARDWSSAGYGEVRRHEARGDVESMPFQQGMREPFIRHHGDKAKSGNKRLSPITRFLRSRVGQPWDDVFSELCSGSDNSSASGRALRETLDWQVETGTRLVDGEIVVNGRFGIHVVRGFYVDPLDGLLREAPGRKRDHWLGSYRTVLDGIHYADAGGVLVPRNCRYPRRKVIRHGAEEAASFDGIWYWVTFSAARPPVKVGGTPGFLACRSSTDIVTLQEATAGSYRSGKLQMSSHDLRRLGLANTAASG